MGGRRVAARPLLSAITVAALAAALIAADGQSATQGEPSPLRGVPLGSNTGLRLLVADNPPFVLDVDRGSVTRVSGIPAVERRTLTVVGVGGRGGIVVDVRAPGCAIRKPCLYAVRGLGARVVPLGTGRNVAAAADGRSVWLQSASGDSLCVVRRVGLDGLQLAARRPFPCSWGLDPAGELGLIVRRNGDRVIDPVTGRTVLRSWGVLGVGRSKAVIRCPGARCSLLDTETGRQSRVRWNNPFGGLREAAADPGGRFLAVSFGIPAWPGGGQVLDVWTLDMQTGKLTRVPGMPAIVKLKFTSVSWTQDGRLVILGESGTRAFVAVWRPGERLIAVKGVRLPQRTAGSDTFAVLG